MSATKARTVRGTTWCHYMVHTTHPTGQHRKDARSSGFPVAYGNGASAQGCVGPDGGTHNVPALYSHQGPASSCRLGTAQAYGHSHTLPVGLVRPAVPAR